MLPDEWVDRLFLRFSTMYGSAWLEKWRGIPMDEVRRTWAADLGGFDGETLRRALEHVKSNCSFPPSCPEFVAICKQFRAPPAQQTYLPAPQSRMPAEAAAALQQFVSGRKDYRGWAKKILANPKLYPHISVEFAKEAQGVA